MTSFTQYESPEQQFPKTKMPYVPDMDICQTDYPLDWYQQDFIPYAEEFQALPDRKLETIVKWMEGYVRPALDYFGDKILLLAHYYMGGEIVKLIEHFGGEIGDSYQLALKAADNPQKEIIIESAVHFMAESISILAHPHQKVYITNPKAGCTMEMHAKDYMVEPALEALNERYGAENIIPICYMNTSGRIKALAGAQGGAVCTSSNVEKIFRWAREKNKKIIFIPDEHMGRNVAAWVGISPERTVTWPGGAAGAQYNLEQQDENTLKRFDDSELILFQSSCSVHAYFHPDMISYWRDKGYATVVHPECRYETTSQADACGSTALIWDYVSNDKAGTKKYAIGTENHMVQNVAYALKSQGFDVVNLGDAKLSGFSGMGCGCATMSRNDPPHMVALLDLLRKGKDVTYNQVYAGDVVNEFSGSRKRLNEQGQEWLRENACKALRTMIEITES